MKRQYKLATLAQTASGFILLLDDAPARTPLGVDFVIINKQLADEIVAEWQAQGDIIRKETMPLTQLATIAIDLAEVRRSEVVADILSYADTDLVCYRAGDIPALLQRQAELLDPIIAWAHTQFDITLHITDGVMPIAQPLANKIKLAAILKHYDSWRLAALVACIKPLGSLMLALAFTHRYIDAAAAFECAHLEESYETQKWGADEEKESRMSTLKQEIASVERFLKLI